MQNINSHLDEMPPPLTTIGDHRKSPSTPSKPSPPMVYNHYKTLYNLQNA